MQHFKSFDEAKVLQNKHVLNVQTFNKKIRALLESWIHFIHNFNNRFHFKTTADVC